MRQDLRDTVRRWQRQLRDEGRGSKPATLKRCGSCQGRFCKSCRCGFNPESKLRDSRAGPLDPTPGDALAESQQATDYVRFLTSHIKGWETVNPRHI